MANAAKRIERLYARPEYADFFRAGSAYGAYVDAFFAQEGASATRRGYVLSHTTGALARIHRELIDAGERATANQLMDLGWWRAVAVPVSARWTNGAWRDETGETFNATHFLPPPVQS